jgi:hypothetical protein
MPQIHDSLNRRSTYSTPRWVKVFGIIALVLVLLIGIMLLSGGEHGPGRHLPPASVTESGDAGGHTPPIEHAGQQP